MIGSAVTETAIPASTFYSLDKLVKAVNQKLLELHNAFIRWKECKDGGKEEEQAQINESGKRRTKVQQRSKRLYEMQILLGQ